MTSRPCAVPGCSNPRNNKRGKYCHYHDGRNERTGHPMGRTITKGDLGPYRKQAEKHIHDNRYHWKMQGVLDWIARTLAAGQPCGNYPKTTRQDVLRWLYRLNTSGVKPEEFLAVVLGMYIMRDRAPQHFLDDRHFRHQLIHRLCLLAPAPHVEVWNGREVRRRYQRISVRVRETLGEHLETSLGAFCLYLVKYFYHQWDNESEAARELFGTPFLPYPTKPIKDK